MQFVPVGFTGRQAQNWRIFKTQTKEVERVLEWPVHGSGCGFVLDHVQQQFYRHVQPEKVYGKDIILLEKMYKLVVSLVGVPRVLCAKKRMKFVDKKK